MIPRDEELVYRTRWLVRIRWLFAAVMGLAAGGSWLLGLAFPTVPLLAVTGSVALYNLVFSAVAARAVAGPIELRRVRSFVNLQISADFVALLAWVHYTGGPASPFLPFFAFHLVICGLLVSARATITHAAWVVAALLAMGIGEACGIIRHHSPLEEAARRPIDSVTYLLAGGIVTAVTLLTMAALSSGIALRLRRREELLVQARQEIEDHARELEVAQERLERLDKERIAFFRLVSHQLRAPLTSIQTVLRLVTAGYAEDREKATELVGRAERQAQHMLALINDMLSLTRVKAPEETEARELVAIGPIIADAMEAVQNPAHEKEVSLSARVDPHLPSLCAVRNKLEQLFTILLENAVKYTPRGGEVSVRAAAQGDLLRVAVTDTGIGIPREEQEAIFGEFYRASNARLYERVGTGLGLAIAKGIVDGLGGSIEVESGVGQGSTFTVVLPAAPQAE